MVVAAGIGSIDFMVIFDVLLMIYGVYSIYAAIKMKKTGKPASWLLAADEMTRIRKQQEFCDEIAPKTILFGAASILYGIYGMLMDLVAKSRIAGIVGIIVYIVVAGWFLMVLKKTKNKYIKL